MTILYNFLLVVFVVNCVLLILIILLQSNRSSGAGIFGGGSGSAFGASSGDVLSKITSVMVGIFLILGLFLSYLKSTSKVDIDTLKKEFSKKEEIPSSVEDSKLKESNNSNIPKEETGKNDASAVPNTQSAPVVPK